MIMKYKINNNWFVFYVNSVYFSILMVVVKYEMGFREGYKYR